VRPIYARYQDRVALDGVADLSKVPRFARGMVRAFFRGQLDYPVMLDWSGEVATRYRYQPGEANLFAIDPTGRIMLKVIGDVSHPSYNASLQLLAACWPVSHELGLSLDRSAF